MKYMLEMIDINKKYGKGRILKDLNFSMKRGDVFSVMGRSGAGKTTMLRIIAGLEKADGGIVKIDGNRASDGNIFIHPSKRNIGFVFQDPCLWPHMTMKENIEYALSEEYKDSLTEISRIAGILGIMDKYPNEVSEGEGKRVSIIRSLCSGADLILMDEPFADLDYNTKNSLMDLLKKIHEMKNLTMLMVSHNMEENLMFSDRIFVLEDGFIDEK